MAYEYKAGTTASARKLHLSRDMHPTSGVPGEEGTSECVIGGARINLMDRDRVAHVTGNPDIDFTALTRCVVCYRQAGDQAPV